MKEKTVLDTYEEKKNLVQEFNLTSDLFASKVFEDIEACQELCRILLRDRSIMIQSVRTQYVIRNLETHSMELDILAERTRYYLSGIDMSILEKGKDYDELPSVTIVYLTKGNILRVMRRLTNCLHILRIQTRITGQRHSRGL